MTFLCIFIALCTLHIALKTGNKSGLQTVKTLIAQCQQFYNVLYLFEIATMKNSKRLQCNNNIILKFTLNFLCIVNENI